MKTKPKMPTIVTPDNRVLRLLYSVITFALVYANFAVIFGYPLQQLHLRKLPLPESVRDGFTIFGVFSYFEKSN
jgi:hypothetical protein